MLLLQFLSARNQSGKVTLGDLPPVMVKLKTITDMLTEDEVKDILSESSSDLDQEVDFESFLRVCICVFFRTTLVFFHNNSFIWYLFVHMFICHRLTDCIIGCIGKRNQRITYIWIVQAYLNLQARATAKMGDSKTSSSFLKATTTTLRHTISESEKSSYVSHINSFLGEDPFLKEYLPIDPSSNALFELAKDGVLLWYWLHLVILGNMEYA